jgi:threonylcarbamoyladenosine tRNA methylthiotransferase MtaB
MDDALNAKRSPSVAAVTMGCKLNYSETSAILDRLSAEGWKLSSLDAGADMIIIHTCSVTSQAEQKCRQKIRRIIRRHPESVVVVIGCYAQLQPGLLAGIEGVAAVLGSSDKFVTATYRELLDQKQTFPLVRVSDIGSTETVFPGYSLSVDEGEARTRAFLKIQDGCDYACAYCTIPHARGRSRSLPSEELVARARSLAFSGYREIVLTGVNIGDYRGHASGLVGLLRMLEDVSVDRIRISSLEPDILDDELIETVAASKKITPHFHVPLQSGSDSILKAMRRRYTTESYREKLVRAVGAISDCAIGADVIAGYPGESEEDFMQMYRFIEGLPIAYLHVFTCSVRPGTVLAAQLAADERRLPSPVELDRRSRLLIELGKRKTEEYSGKFIGRECEILVEASLREKSGRLVCSGYTAHYLHVTAEAGCFEGNTADLKGRLLPVRIAHMDDDLNLHGRLLF